MRYRCMHNRYRCICNPWFLIFRTFFFLGLICFSRGFHGLTMRYKCMYNRYSCICNPLFLSFWKTKSRADICSRGFHGLKMRYRCMYNRYRCICNPLFLFLSGWYCCSRVEFFFYRVANFAFGGFTDPQCVTDACVTVTHACITVTDAFVTRLFICFGLICCFSGWNVFLGLWFVIWGFHGPNQSVRTRSVWEYACSAHARPHVYSA